jgi:hypothetical protein
MRRLFWLTVGAGLGGYAVHKANEARRKLTPESVAGRIADRATGLGSGLRDFAGEVRDGAAAREREINRALGRDRAGFPPANDMHDDDGTRHYRKDHH